MICIGAHSFVLDRVDCVFAMCTLLYGLVVIAL